MSDTVDIMAEEFKIAYPLTYDAIYNKGRADAIDECVFKLALDENTILSDKQYYTLMMLKAQKGGRE